MCSFLVWKNACLNYREFDLEGDLVGVPHTWYLSAQSFITLLKFVWREYDIVAMNEWKKKCVGLQWTWVSKRTVWTNISRKILSPIHSIIAQLSSMEIILFIRSTIYTVRRSVPSFPDIHREVNQCTDAMRDPANFYVVWNSFRRMSLQTVLVERI